MPDLTGKVVIVTGGNTGSGLITLLSSKYTAECILNSLQSRVRNRQGRIPSFLQEVSRTTHFQALLEHNAKVYLAARSPDKALAAIEKLKSETGGKEAIFLRLDLASLADVKRSAMEFKSKEEQLHILINNALDSCPSFQELT